jgi:hypothetical protein
VPSVESLRRYGKTTTQTSPNNDYLEIPCIIVSEEFIAIFKDYPPSQAPASFTVDPDSILHMLHPKAAKTGKD